MAIKVPNFT